MCISALFPPNYFYYLRQGGYVFIVVCLSVCSQLCAKTSEQNCMKFSGKVCDGPLNNWLNFDGDPDHCLDTGIVFRICHYWEIRKLVSTDCAARRCSAGHAPVGIAIATMMSLHHWPTTDVPWRRYVPELLVYDNVDIYLPWVIVSFRYW